MTVVSAAPMQRSFDELGSALVDTTFCVFDLETTGGSPASNRITEIGAVKVRGGEVLGEFNALVNPGVAIPPAITMLTGITDQMVAGAPRIEFLLPAFIEFIGGATLVAHNASFDTRFLGAALEAHGYQALNNPVVCTVRLARRLVRDEVPNLQLATLSQALRARTVPSHRALDDARATTDVFHSLLELAGRWGVSHLDDLLWFQSARGHPSYNKARLAADLPRARGVYLFTDETGGVLYVGKATDLRARVRSYFGGDERRRIDDLLRALHSVQHMVCASDLEASVLEARLIRRHAPPFNRAQRGRARSFWLRLTGERFPRLSRAHSPPGLGPLPASAIEAVRDALEAASPIRTCTMRIGSTPRASACVRGQIGRCPAPCAQVLNPGEYGAAIEPVARALDGDATRILSVLEDRLQSLSEQQRFEEAVSVREHVRALVDAARRVRAAAMLARAGTLRLVIGSSIVSIREGRLHRIDGRALPIEADEHPDEPRLVAAWLARNLARIRLMSCEGEAAEEVGGGSALARWSARLKARDRGADG